MGRVGIGKITHDVIESIVEIGGFAVTHSIVPRAWPPLALRDLSARGQANSG